MRAEAATARLADHSWRSELGREAEALKMRAAAFDRIVLY